jgi:hypothetical protein
VNGFPSEAHAPPAASFIVDFQKTAKVLLFLLLDVQQH